MGAGCGAADEVFNRYRNREHLYRRRCGGRDSQPLDYARMVRVIQEGQREIHGRRNTLGRREEGVPNGVGVCNERGWS